MQWFDQAASLYLADSKGRYQSPATYTNKRKFLDRLRRFLGDKDLDEQVSFAFCASLPTRGKKGLSVRSAHTETVQLRTFIKFCFARKFIAVNFVDAIKKPQLDSEQPQIPLVDMETAEKAIILGTEKQHWYNKVACRVNDDMRIALRLVLYTGLRFSEVAHLQQADLFLDAAPAHMLVKLKARKQKSQIYLPKEAVKLLRPLADRKQLFKITDDTCNRAINRGLKALKIPFEITCHGLRHIVGNESTRQGMSGYYVQKYMQHRHYETTVQYYLQNNLNDLAHQIDLYNPLARRALTTQDKLNAVYDQVRRWIGDDTALVVEKREGDIHISIR